METTRRFGKQRRGAALLAVLIIIALMATFATLYIEISMLGLRESAPDFRRDNLRVAAYSALGEAIAVLEEYREIEKALRHPGEGWGNPRSLHFAETEEAEEDEEGAGPNYQVSVEITDESAKIPLHAAEPMLLEAIFVELGFRRSQAQDLRDSLLDWIDEDDNQRRSGAEEKYYRRQGIAGPANGPIRTLDELADIRYFDELFFDEEDGLPLPVFEVFKQMVSLHHEGAMNINTADPALIEIIEQAYGWTADDLRFTLDGPDGEPGTEDDDYIESLEGAPAIIATEAALLRIRIQVRRGEASYRLETLVNTPASSSQSNTSNNNSSGNNNASNNNGNNTPRVIVTPGRGNNSQSENSANFNLLRLRENSPLE